MTRRRWIADQVSGDRAVLAGEKAHHLSRVLRVKLGQEFDIATGTNVRRGRVIEMDEGQVAFELGEVVPIAPSHDLTLVIAIIQFDRMEWAIEKCTELGVSRIVPLVARRTETHLAAAALKRVDRWKRIVREASQQSRRDKTPEISAPMKLNQAVKLAGACRILLNESEDKLPLREALATCSRDASVILALGPEGGWTSDELKLFRQEQWISASLGTTILRTETAAIAALAVVVSGLE